MKERIKAYKHWLKRRGVHEIGKYGFVIFQGAKEVL